MDYLSINEKGRLSMKGHDLIDISEKFGTPIYIMNEKSIRNSCKKFVNAINKYYDSKGLVLFASKSLNCKEICKIINEENMGIDVVSGGELYTAIKANFPMSKVHFHGNNKTPEELHLAINSGVGRIVVDNEEELKMLNNIAQDKNKICNILLRIKPGVDAHTHEFIKTGRVDSKFGITMKEGITLLENIQRFKNINFMGFHCHIGSQILDSRPFILAASIMVEFISKVKSKTGLSTQELNLGGGFGIQYTENDKYLDYDKCIKEVSIEIKEKCEDLKLNIPYMYIEPGRSIVGSAGITLYKIGNIKKIPGIRTYVAIDGSMADNPRHIMYGSEYTVINASKANIKPNKLVTIAGKCCESGDIISEDVLLADPEVDDIIAILCTGAYNYSMASNYNRTLKPPILMINKNKLKTIVKRQSLEDLISLDI
jgi:diaminopimelate decarboxylase